MTEYQLGVQHGINQMEIIINDFIYNLTIKDGMNERVIDVTKLQENISEVLMQIRNYRQLVKEGAR